MNKKIMAFFLIIAVLLCSIAIVSAQNNTTNVTNDTEDTIDLSNYITALSSGKEIQFSDGYTGYLIDTSKNELTDKDGFTSYPTTSIEGNIGNYLKLAVIECYKQDKETEISDVISMILDGSYKNRENPIISEVLKYDSTINDHESIEIDNSTEGTFDFELLKPRNQATSDYFAYKVSLKTIENDDKLGVAEDNDTNQTKEIENKTDAANEVEQNQTENNNTTVKNEVEQNQTENNNTTVKNEEVANDTNTSKANVTDNTTKENSTEKRNETKTIETNKTIVNKTNTLTINENNTTVVNKTTITHINNTTNDTPQNNTIADNLMKTVGNPISILIIVIVVIAIAAIAMRRKD